MSLHFDSQNEHVLIADNPKWDWTPGTHSRTVAFWFKLETALNADGEYLQAWTSSMTDDDKVSAVYLRMSGNNILAGQLTDYAGANLGAFYTPWTPTPGTWYHVVLGFSTNGNCKIWINGSSQSVTHSGWGGSGFSAISANYTSLSSYYGNANLSSHAFDIAHFAFFNKLLSDAEVSNLYGNPAYYDSDASCLCSIHCDEGTGTTAADDQTQNTATDGTLANSPEWTTGPSTSTNKSVSDAGAGADSVAISASISISDAGTGSDSVTAGGPHVVADSGAGSDSVTVRKYFGAKYEPPTGRALHGMGQFIDVFYTPEEEWQLVADYETAVGNDPVMYSSYTAIDPAIDWMDISYFTADHPIDYVLLIGLMLWDAAYGASMITAPSKILGGDYDARIIEIARQVKNVRGPIFIRPGFEFGSGNSGVHSLGMTAAQFVSIWQYIKDIFDAQGANNVAWVWSTVNPDDFTFADWYPGDDYVDWVGINYFTASQIAAADPFLEFAASHGKPVMICESCPISGNGTLDSANWANWFVPFFAKIAEYDHIKAFIYISDPWDKEGYWDEWPDSRINNTTTNATILAGYIAELADEKYIHLDEYLSEKTLIIPSGSVFLATPITGQGSVTRTPDAAEYTVNTEVTLQAVPAENWGFKNWGGDLSGSTNPDDITLTADATVSALFAAMIAVADAGAGADALAGIAASLQITESGHGADASPAPGAQVPLAETGHGTDALGQILAVLGVAETGHGADALAQILASLQVAESGHGADSLGGLSATLLITEAGHGDEAPHILAALTISDLGQGNDAASLLQALLKTVADSGLGTDAVGQVRVSLIIPDTGQGNESPQIVAVLSLSDAGQGMDAISVITALLKTIADIGAGADAVAQIGASLGVADSGAGADSPAIRVSLSIADLGAGADAINTLQTLLVQVADIAGGTDALGSVSVIVPVSDSGHGVDLIALIGVVLSVADSAHGVDVAIRYIQTEAKSVTVTFTKKSPSASFVLKKPTVNFTN